LAFFSRDERCIVLNFFKTLFHRFAPNSPFFILLFSIFILPLPSFHKTGGRGGLQVTETQPGSPQALS
jgi:hypothetical protein